MSTRKRVAKKRKTASLKRALAAANRWRYLGYAETSHGTVEVYSVDGTELRFGCDDALREYGSMRAPEWQKRQLGGVRL
jgi:hypothetical protein